MNELAAIELCYYEAGNYNPQFRRSLQLSMTPAHMMAYDEASQGGTRLDQAAIQRLSSEVVDVSAHVERSNITHDGSVYVDGGWNQERARFILTIEKKVTHNCRKLYHYIGWTDQVGWTLRGTQESIISDDMRMYLNQVIVVHENTVIQHGVPVKRTAIDRCDTFLNGYFVTQGGPGINDYSMRPIEILQQLGAATVMNHARMDIGAVLPTHCQFIQRVKHSHSDNHTPTSWLNRILSSHVQYNVDKSDGRYDSTVLVHDAASKAGEYTLSEEPLINLLGSEMLREYGFITYGQLRRVFPDIGLIAETRSHESRGGFWGASVAGETAYIGDSTVESKLAALLHTSLPTLVSNSGLRFVNFRFTNNNPTMQPVMALVPLQPLPGETMPRPPIGTLSKDSVGALHWELFQRKFMDELCGAVTGHRTQIVDFFASLSITGDLKLTISINGQPNVDYRLPCFLGNLVSNLLTNDANRLVEYAADISNLVNAGDSASALRSIQGGDPWAPQYHTPSNVPTPSYSAMPTPTQYVPTPTHYAPGGMPTPSQLGGMPTPSQLSESAPSSKYGAMPRPTNVK